MTELPQPLTPPDCDLSGYRFMPLDVVRLKGSELASSHTPEECWAALRLWCASWQQTPAGSIPDNDNWIADQAGYSVRGRIDRAWKNVRKGALHGWVKCSDGLLYHPVVAEKALEGWIGKLLSRLAGGIGNAKRWGKEFDVDTVRGQIIEACRLLRAIAPQSEMFSKKQVIAILSGSPPESHPDSPPDDENVAPRQLDLSPPESGGDRNREGDREGYIKEERISTGDNSTEVGVEPTRIGQICVALRRVGVMVSPHQLQIAELARQDVAVESIVAAAEEARRSHPNESIGINLVIAILTAWAKKAQAMNVAGARPPPAQSSTSSRDASRAAAANSIGLGARNHDPEPDTFDATTGQRVD